jgi:hypothetical protein
MPLSVAVQGVVEELIEVEQTEDTESPGAWQQQLLLVFTVLLR